MTGANAPGVPKELIAPGVFKEVADYAASMKDGTVKLDKPLVDTTPIILFCQNFFAQFFDNVVNSPIEGIDQQSKEESVALRHAMSDDETKVVVRKMLALFEELCDEWPEVLGLISGFLRDDLLDFHVLFLPSLFEGINEWASTLGGQLAQAAKDAGDKYAEGLVVLRKSRGLQR